MDKSFVEAMRNYLFSAAAMNGCAERNNNLATQYKMDLQYHDQAINLQKKAWHLRQRCHAIKHHLKMKALSCIVQIGLDRNDTLSKVWCDEIRPREKVKMTGAAYEIVYPEMMYIKIRH
jgi:hypothetical protein